MNFFDLQVNGYAGIDFNSDDLSADGLHTACAALEADGVSDILATIITEKLPTMAARLERLVELRERDELAQKIIAGFHIEGPFLNENAGFRGAHPEDSIVPANLDDAKRLLEATNGLARLVTLAPERDLGQRVTRFLVEEGVKVSGGHSDASRDDLRAAVDAGLSLWTHLGNGCPMNLERHDNIIQRVLSVEQIWKCFIADGAHVPFWALKNYLKAAGVEKSVVVTDAIAPASLGPGNYSFGRWNLKIGDDMVARAPDGSHLVGAAITMPQSAANLEEMGFSAPEIRLLTSENPRQALEIAVGA